VTEIRLWDDLQPNLNAFRSFKKQCEVGGGPTVQVADVNKFSSGRRCNSELEEWLHCCGLLPTRSHQTSAAAGLGLLLTAYRAVLENFTGAEYRLPHVTDAPSGHAVFHEFGSFPLGRGGDVDVCFLAPSLDGTSVRWWLSEMEQRLRAQGIVFTYLSGPGRCPRLKVRVEFQAGPAVEFDVVVALLPRRTFDALMMATARGTATDGATTVGEGPIAVGRSTTLAAVLPDAVDEASRLAMEGPVFLASTVATLNTLGLSRSNFGLLLEATKTVLRLLHCSGNEFHCLRTFHIVTLLLDALTSLHATGTSCSDQANLDTLLAACLKFMVTLSLDHLGKLFVDVPRVHLHRFLARLRTVVEAHPEKIGYGEMGRIIRDRPAASPSAGAIHITLHHTCQASPVVQWRVATFARGRLGTYVRRLIDLGIEVHPNSDTSTRTDCLRFSLSSAPSTPPLEEGALEEVTRTTLHGLWRELEIYRAQGAHIRFVVNTESASSDTAHAGDTSTNPEVHDLFLDAVAGLNFRDWAEKRIDAFVADESTAPEILSFEPTLTSGERSMVHGMAEARGLPHCSTGERERRHVVVYRKGTVLPVCP